MANAAAPHSCPNRRERSRALAKKNFGFEKRQKELKKKAKQEEKRLRKLERASGGGTPESGDEAEEPEGEEGGGEE